MKKSLIVLSLAFCKIIFSAGLNAKYDLTVANKLFELRGESTRKLEEGLNMYENLIKSAQNLEQKEEALRKFARLSIFKGEFGYYTFPKHYQKNAKAQGKVYERCLDLTHEFSALERQRSREYTYWRAACLGLWAKYSGKNKLLSAMKKLKELKSLIKRGQEEYPNFEEGGFNAMAASFMLRSHSLPFFNNYDEEEVYELIEKSLGHGANYYARIFTKADFLVANHDNQGAFRLLNQSVMELERKYKSGLDSHFDDYWPETKALIKKLKNKIRKIS